MKSLLFSASLLVATATLNADEPSEQLPTDTLLEVVAVSQANFDSIDTLTAVYKWHETSPNRPPRVGNTHFVWDRRNNRFRSAFKIDGHTTDTITTPSEFVRIGQGRTRTSPPADSRKYWSADVLSPARLFGTGDRPLWQRLKTYTTWAEANDRITITSSQDDDDLTYTIRMAYTGLRDNKVFVTRTLSKSNAFNPTLIVRSKGTDIATARLIDVTSWTYQTIDGIVIPRSNSVSKFNEHTGAPVSQRNMHLRTATLNGLLDESVFSTELAAATENDAFAFPEDRPPSALSFKSK